jgi:Fe2+ transport system protein FeoA
MKYLKKFVIHKIESQNQNAEKESEDMVKRLYELGLRPGIEVYVIQKVSFGSVTIIQYGPTRLALNEQEMSCLHGL